MTEKDLILGLQVGDAVAFKFIVDTYKDKLYNTSLAIVQNQVDAEDVAQEVFIQIFR